MLKAYRYKLNPNYKQKVLLLQTLDTCRELYNMCLEQKQYQRIGRFEQDKQLTVLKAGFPEYSNVYSEVLQNVIKKVDRSFQAFFRRVKNGEKAGYPRFKGRNRYDSFQFNNKGFSLDGTYLKVSKLGNIKVRLSRPLPEHSIIKTLSIKRFVNGWFAVLVVDIPFEPLSKNDKVVGIDVGVSVFATLSDGTTVLNPRFYQNAQAELRVAQRRVARRKKGSNRRRKAVLLLKKLHGHIAAKRSDFLHKQSTAVIQKYGIIVVEDLNVAAMSRSNLAKQILDCSWSEWVRQLVYKAAYAGRQVLAVAAQYTSQECSECGLVHAENRKTQAEFKCLRCGFESNADKNAAINIAGRIDLLDANVGELTPCVV